MNKFIIGREEWIELPSLGLKAIKAKVDSGAKTSALHAVNISRYKDGDSDWVSFEIHPIQHNRKITRKCTAPVVAHRTIISSNGEREKRYVIRTPIKLGEHAWDVEVTLTNRDSMGCRMLLGREAMHNRLLVDPDKTCVIMNFTEKEIIACYKQDTDNKESLNIALLGSDPKLYSNQRIIQAGILRGHNMRFINVKDAYMNISNNTPEIFLDGEPLDNVDAVIPRLRSSVTFYGCALTRQFQAIGAFCLNDANSIAKSRDKFLAMQLLANRISIPTTGFANSTEETRHLIKMVGGAPLIVKLLEGAKGMGVVLAETDISAESIINALKILKANILVQEFIKEAKGRDIRCFVIDGKVVGAMERRAKDNEFRANLHLGGTSRPVRLSKEEKKIAVAATNILGLKVAGVDLIRSDTGPKLLEVNSSPGLEGIELTTGKDIASMMIECVETHILGRAAKKKGKKAAVTETKPGA